MGQTGGVPGPERKPKEPCSVEGCDLLKKSRGYCEKHYKRWRLYGDPLLTAKATRPQEPKKLCRAPGCTRKSLTKGCCDKHYRQLQVHGEFLEKKREGCAVEGCLWPVVRKGYCRHHYYRFQRFGDPLLGTPIPKYEFRKCAETDCDQEAGLGRYCRYHEKQHKTPEKVVPCKVEGCEKKVFANGYCQAHNKRWRVYGDPLGGRATPIKDRRCSVAGCDERSFAHGMCMPHFGQFRYHGDPTVRVNDPTRGCSVPGCNDPHRGLGFCGSHLTQYVGGPRRRNKIKMAKGTCTGPQLMARIDYFGGLCWICKDPMEAVDHVKPIVAGGALWPSNLRPICRTCNSSKAGRWYGVAGLPAHAERIRQKKLK